MKNFTTSDKELVLQFLRVLHTWLHDNKREKEKEIEVLNLQEGIVKLLFARLTADDDMDPEDIVLAAENIFNVSEEEYPLQEEPTQEEKLGQVIDIASWVRQTISEEPEEEDAEE